MKKANREVEASVYWGSRDSKRSEDFQGSCAELEQVVGVMQKWARQRDGKARFCSEFTGTGLAIRLH